MSDGIILWENARAVVRLVETTDGITITVNPKHPGSGRERDRCSVWPVSDERELRFLYNARRSLGQVVRR
jgi:hypothetical protein